MRKVLFCVILSACFAISCGAEEDKNPYSTQIDGGHISHPVELMLYPGNLTANSEFEPVDLPLDSAINRLPAARL